MSTSEKNVSPVPKKYSEEKRKEYSAPTISILGTTLTWHKMPTTTEIKTCCTIGAS